MAPDTRSLPRYRRCWSYRWCGCLAGGPLGLLGFVLQLLDERIGLVAAELAAGLALGEPHRAASVAKVSVTGLVQQ